MLYSYYEICNAFLAATQQSGADVWFWRTLAAAFAMIGGGNAIAAQITSSLATNVPGDTIILTNKGRTTTGGPPASAPRRYYRIALVL